MKSGERKPLLFDQFEDGELEQAKRGAELALDLPKGVCEELIREYPALLNMRIEEQVRIFVDSQTQRLSVSADRASKIVEEFLWPILSCYSADDAIVDDVGEEAAAIVDGFKLERTLEDQERLKTLVAEAITSIAPQLRSAGASRRVLDKVVPGLSSFWASAELRVVWASKERKEARVRTTIPVAGFEIRIGDRQNGKKFCFSCTEAELEFIMREIQRVHSEIKSLAQHVTVTGRAEA